MNSIVKLLNSHPGRDKAVRTVGYMSLYLSGVTKGNLSQRLKMMSDELSYCRLIMRLFDDLPMLKYTLSFGLGKGEKDWVLRILGVLTNVIDQLYYPVEHIAWASDKKMLDLKFTKSSSLWALGTTLWGVSLYINIARSLRIMAILQKQTHGLKDLTKHQDIVKRQLEQLLAALKYAADLAIAINHLPFQIMWAGKLNSSQVGLFGLISSLLGIILLMRNMD